LPYEFDTIHVEAAMDLKLIARAAGVTVEEIKYLNPHLRSWHTPKQKGFEVRLPVGAASRFRTAFAQIPTEKTWEPTEHVIRKNETLGDIARRYGASVKTLQQLNGLKGSTIRAGKTLKVPSASGGGILIAKGEKPSGPVVPASPPTASSGRKVKPDGKAGAGAAIKPVLDPTENGRYEIYAIQPGDTLSEIAQAKGVSIQQIRADNGLSPRAKIKAGARLRIRRSSTAPMALAQAEGQGAQYIIRDGDNLWDIAKAHGTTVDRLRADNGLRQGAVLRPGDALIIPPRANNPR
jgi:membrane-bound lytic murein transglycosylase D